MKHWNERDEWVHPKKVTLRPSASCFTYFLQLFSFPSLSICSKKNSQNKPDKFIRPNNLERKNIQLLAGFCRRLKFVETLRNLETNSLSENTSPAFPAPFSTEYSVLADWTGYKSECQGSFGTWWDLESGRKSLPTFRSRSSVKEVQKLCLDIMKTLWN